MAYKSKIERYADVVAGFDPAGGPDGFDLMPAPEPRRPSSLVVAAASIGACLGAALALILRGTK